MKNHVFVTVAILVLAGSSLIVLVHAQQEFMVPPESDKTVTISLDRGESVNGSFSVSGGTGTGVGFCVSDPNGKELISCNFTSTKSFSFSAPTSGTYRLSFDNSFCSCEGGKNVTLDYATSRPASTAIHAKTNQGFLNTTVLILAAAIVAVSAVIILKRRPKTKPSKAETITSTKQG